MIGWLRKIIREWREQDRNDREAAERAVDEQDFLSDRDADGKGPRNER